jgi:hypothetical protein
MLSEKIRDFEKSNSKSLEEIIWNLCNDYFDYSFQFQEHRDYFFFKNCFSKALTVKILNNKEFIELFLSNFNNNRIFYFKSFDEFELAKFYVKDKNIDVKKTKFNLKLIKLKTALYFLKYFRFKDKDKDKYKDKVIFYCTNKKYKPIFDLCEKNIKKNKILYINDIRNDLFKKLSFHLKNNKIYFPSFLKKINSETITNILITYNIVYTFFNKSNFKAIISVEGDSLEHSISAYISNNRFKTICFQWGSLTKNNLKNGFKYMYQNIVFVWSNYYKKKFSEYNPDTKFIINGNNLLNFTKKNKKTDIIFLLNPSEIFISDKTDLEFIKIIRWTKKFINKNIIVRFHPAQDPKKIDYIQNALKKIGIIFHDPKKITLKQSLENVAVGISARSSSLIEISRLGIIPVVFNKKEEKLEEFFDHINKIGHKTESIDGVKKILSRIFRSNSNQKKIKEKIKKIGNQYIKFIGNKSNNITTKELKKVL